jgi:hypothetical protein
MVLTLTASKKHKQENQTMKKRYLWSVLVTTSLVFAQPQQSENFRITKSVIDAGGAVSSSADFRLTSAFGQPSPLGWQSSADFRLSGGFLSPILLVSPLSPIQDLVIAYAALDAHLNWSSRSGAHSYKIYRDTEAMFTPSPSNFIGATADTFFVDANVLNLPEVRYYYNITASSDPATLIAKTGVVARPQSVPYEMPNPMIAPTSVKSPDAPIRPLPNRAKR